MKNQNEKNPAAIELTCSDNVKKILCEALRNYAHEFLPHQSCGRYRVSRGDLLDTVSDIEKSFSGGDQFAVIRNTVMPECKAAVHHHYKSLQQTLHVRVDEQRQLLLDVLHGMSAEDQELDDALRRDEML